MKLEEQNHDTVIALWNIANKKLIPVVNADNGSRILSPEAIRLLRESGLLTDLSIADKSQKKDYLTLSSKGWASLYQTDIASFLAKKSMPLIIPNKLRISNHDWSPLLAARAALIHDFCRKIDKNYVLWKYDTSKMLVAKTAEQSSMTILAGLFQEGYEEADLKDMAATLDSLGDAVNVLILVRRHEDVTVLANKLMAMSTHAANAMLFAVADQDYAIFNLDNISRKPPKDDTNHGITTNSVRPETHVSHIRQLKKK